MNQRQKEKVQQRILGKRKKKKWFKQKRKLSAEVEEEEEEIFRPETHRVEFNGHISPNFHYESGATKNEEEERLRRAVSVFGVFNIVLANKTIKLWRFMLRGSRKIREARGNVFKGMSNLSLDVDPLMITNMLLEKEVVFEFGKELFHYFLFFQGLGLKRQMMMTLRAINRSVIPAPITSLSDQLPPMKDELSGFSPPRVARPNLRNTQERASRRPNPGVVNVLYANHDISQSGLSMPYPTGMLPMSHPNIRRMKNDGKGLDCVKLQNPLSFGTAYKLFLNVINRENETVKNWIKNSKTDDYDDYDNTFDSSDDETTTFDIDTFKHSFTLVLFSHLKTLLKDLRERNNKLLKKKMRNHVLFVVVGLLDEYNLLLHPLDHLDFKFYKKDVTEFSIRKKMRRLRAVPSSSSISLMSTDKKIVKVEPEILVLRSEYFKLMVDGSWAEREILVRESTSSPLVIADMDAKVLNAFLDYLYFGEIDQETPLEVIIKLIILSGKYFDKKMMEYLKSPFNTAVQQAPSNDVERVIRQVGYLLPPLDTPCEVVKVLLPGLLLLGQRSGVVESRVRKLIEKSINKNLLKSKLETILVLEKQNQELRREMEEMKKRMQNLEKLVKGKLKE